MKIFVEIVLACQIMKACKQPVDRFCLLISMAVMVDFLEMLHENFLRVFEYRKLDITNTCIIWTVFLSSSSTFLNVPIVVFACCILLIDTVVIRFD